MHRTINNRNYEVLAFPADDEANAFIKNNNEWSVIEVAKEPYMVYLARVKDTGTLLPANFVIMNSDSRKRFLTHLVEMMRLSNDPIYPETLKKCINLIS